MTPLSITLLVGLVITLFAIGAVWIIDRRRTETKKHG